MTWPRYSASPPKGAQAGGKRGPRRGRGMWARVSPQVVPPCKVPVVAFHLENPKSHVFIFFFPQGAPWDSPKCSSVRHTLWLGRPQGHLHIIRLQKTEV